MDLPLYINIIIVISLVLASGMFSGLTIGLMGLSKTEVIRASDLGNKQATTVLTVIEDSNLLLVTLLLDNTAVNVILPLFLGTTIGTGILAAFVSTLLIMIFGEILPASIVSRHPLAVGSKLTPLVKILIFILYPFTKPIALLLDKYVGKEGIVIFSRRELKHIFEQLLKSKESDIDALDTRVLVGTILLNEKNVGDHMSKNIFSLKRNTVLNKNNLDLIKKRGYTRIPILENNKIYGILNAKELINIDSSERIKIKNLMNSNTKHIYIININDKLDDVMNYMIKKHIHIAIVQSYNSIVGVITLEDILEEMLQSEIIDEFDHKD
jgi:metal transporter CNNM